jgi:hypothetical protein
VLSVGLGPTESAMGLMKKIPHRDDIQVRPRTGERRAGSCAVRNPPNHFKLSQPPQWICRVPAGSRTSRQIDTQRQRRRDLNIISLRPGAEIYLLIIFLKTTWTIYCEAV